MAYSNFTLAKVKETFNLTFSESANIFAEVKGVKPSDILTSILQEYIPLAIAISTEKARYEFLIAPILAEVKRQTNSQVSLFSGTEFNVDLQQGLQGFCDFLISASQEQYFISVPFVTIVEAKNENIVGGFGQCVAEMVAAQLFNQRENNQINTIYGAVTTGTNWRFLKLEGNQVFIDSIEYYIKEVDKNIGIFLQPIQTYLSQN